MDWSATNTVPNQLGEAWAEHIHPDDRNGLRDLWIRTMYGCPMSTSFTYEFRFMRPDGEVRYLLAQCLRDTTYTSSDDEGVSAAPSATTLAAGAPQRHTTWRARLRAWPVRRTSNPSRPPSTYYVGVGAAGSATTSGESDMPHAMAALLHRGGSSVLAVGMPSAASMAVTNPVAATAAAATSGASPTPTAAMAAAAGIRGLVCGITDLTEHKRLERARLEALEHASRVQTARADEAEAHQREQERFVDVICHEIRNPLNGIVNNLDLLRTTRERRMAWLASHPAPTALEVAACVQELREEEAQWTALDLCAQHQRRITDDVLHFSRLHAGYFSMEERAFALSELVETTVGMVRAAAESARVEIVCTYAPACAEVPRVRSDPQRISQVLLNFISNAVKFTRLAGVRRVHVHADLAMSLPPPPPSVVSTVAQASTPTGSSDGVTSPNATGRRPSRGWISADVSPALPRVHITAPSPAPTTATTATTMDPGDVDAGAGSANVAQCAPGDPLWLTLSVTDTGIGMTTEEQARLFMPFRQANVKTYSTYGGSGMGLFISKAIADLLHGEIRLQSQPGQGTTFSLHVPCARADDLQAGMNANQADLSSAGFAPLVRVPSNLNFRDPPLARAPSPLLLPPPTSLGDARLSSASTSPYGSNDAISSSSAPSTAGDRDTLAPIRRYRILGKFLCRRPCAARRRGTLTAKGRTWVGGGCTQWWTTTTSTGACCRGSWRRSRRCPWRCTRPATAKRRWTCTRRRSPLLASRTTSSLWTWRCPSWMACRRRAASAATSTSTASPRPSRSWASLAMPAR
jgi:signal transduction histidine kinase